MTNDGGVYTTGSQPFYGSLFTVGAGGPNSGVGAQVKVTSPNTYQITTAHGQTYNFGPGGVVQ